MPSPTRILTSPNNPRVRAAASLRDRRERERTGLTIVDGAREIRRAIEAGVDVVELFVCEGRLGGPDARWVLDQAGDLGPAVTPTDARVIDRLGFGDRSEGLVAVVRTPAARLEDLVVDPEGLIVVVEGVEKPGNLGAALRSADGAGAGAVIAAGPVVDLFNPNVIRASAGTVFAMPLAAAPTDEVLVWLRDRDIRIVAAQVDAARRYTAVDLTGPVALVLGAEADGLSVAWQSGDVEAVSLPMLGIADSLNVSVTAAILLYEARRQRDLAAATPRS